MLLRRGFSGLSVLLAALALITILPSQPAAQQSAAVRGKALTIERIYSQPSLSGRLTRGLTWTPDGKQLGYFETKGSGKEPKPELWVTHPPNADPRPSVS